MIYYTEEFPRSFNSIHVTSFVPVDPRLSYRQRFPVDVEYTTIEEGARLAYSIVNTFFVVASARRYIGHLGMG